jgi:glycosyltransferase involved in cell wall biosynthesis
MIILFSTIVFSYVLLILSFIYGFNRIPYFKYEVQQTKTAFSIVIPFRDEAERLPKLLASISNIDYTVSQFEIIFMNDGSIDNSEALIESHFINTDITYRIIQNNRQSNSPKKDAITIAIQHANHDWIITSDADCILPKTWLKAFDAFIESRTPNMIVAPVTYKNDRSFLHYFQILDFWSLQTVTIGAFGLKTPFLCNGANLAFTKNAFHTLDGYIGNDSIASGDDIFLMEKLLENSPESVAYLKSRDAIVTTYSESTWTKLYNQRLRWAAKTSGYARVFPKLIGLLVLLTNSSIIIMAVLYLIGLLALSIFCFLFLLKIVVDYWAISKSARFFNTKKPLYYYPLSTLCYPIFSSVIACNSLFFKYKWKGRYFRK